LVDLGLQESPVVGDWCAVSEARIEGVLPRRTVLYRAAVDSTRDSAGSREAAVANIDTVAVVMDIALDFNLRRIERFLANTETGGAEAALILTKIDLVEEPEAFRRRTAARFTNLPIFLVDSISGRGRDELDQLLEPGHTVAFVGLSGAGKSTLLNMLLGKSMAKTAEVRERDGRGRHTTTERSLYLLPGESLIIDTPGIRAVGISAGSEAVRSSFEDIHALAADCRFSDCTHRHEPGCAVRGALAEGRIEQDRYLNFLRILSEAVTAEEEQRRRREKEDYIGKIQYQMRRARQRRDRHGG
jgi:ribosome biogenesis GTPase